VLPNLLAGFKGPASRGREETGREGRSEEGEGKGRYCAVLKIP